MSKITPKAMKEIFTEDVLAELPSNDKIKLSAASKRRFEDPEFAARMKETVNKTRETKEWKENHLKGTRDRYKKGYLEKHREIMKKDSTRGAIKKANAEKRGVDSEWRKNQGAAARKNIIEAASQPGFKEHQHEGYERRQENKEWFENMKAAGIKRRKPMMTPDGAFDGKTSAREYWIDNHNSTRDKFDGLIKRNSTEFYYITHEEYQAWQLEQNKNLKKFKE